MSTAASSARLTTSLSLDGDIYDQFSLNPRAWFHSRRRLYADCYRRLPAYKHETHRRSRKPSRSEEHTSELQSLMRSSYAVFCVKQKNKQSHTISVSNAHKHKKSI